MVPPLQPPQSGTPFASSWQMHEHVLGSSWWVGPQSCVVSQTHWHDAGSSLKPGAHDVVWSHEHEHDAASHFSCEPQALLQLFPHCTVHVDVLQTSVDGNVPWPQFAGH
jgi:hypothetical protein